MLGVQGSIIIRVYVIYYHVVGKTVNEGPMCAVKYTSAGSDSFFLLCSNAHVALPTIWYP